MARSRREAKMIIDEMKDDITGMYEMQKRAMGLGGGRRRKQYQQRRKCKI